MLTKSQAIDAVRKMLPDDHDVVEEDVIEKEYGWVIFCQTKRYLQSKHFRDLSVGSSGILVEKNTGRLIHFASAYSTEVNLKIYERGYLAYDNFDLVIITVSNPEEAVQFLRKLGITYVEPEVAYGETWRIPKSYSVQQLRERLRQLPCRLNLGSAYFVWKELERMKGSPSLRFELVANTGLRNEAN
jgi:hypothetical protein